MLYIYLDNAPFLWHYLKLSCVEGRFLSSLHNWNSSKGINHSGDMSGHWSATFVVSLHISILARVFLLSRNALCIVALIIALKTNKKKPLVRDLYSLHGNSVKRSVCQCVCVSSLQSEVSEAATGKKEDWKKLKRSQWRRIEVTAWQRDEREPRELWLRWILHGRQFLISCALPSAVSVNHRSSCLMARRENVKTSLLNV